MTGDMIIRDALGTLHPVRRIDALDAFATSPHAPLRCWAIDEGRRVRDELAARRRADAAAEERRRRIGERYIAVLRQMLAEPQEAA